MGSLLLLLLLGSESTVWGPGAVGRTTLLVGVQVEGQEVGVVEALSTEQGVCMPAEDFARFTGSFWDDKQRLLRTPLGEAALSPGELVEVEATRYLCPAVAQTRLGVGFTFDPSTVTLVLDLPWSVRLPARAQVPLIPELRPPAWGLGALRAEGWWLREGSEEAHAGSLTVWGRAAGGEWRLLADRPGDKAVTFREFYWTRRWTHTFLGLGRSWVQLSPLLSGYDFVGAQIAWSNERLPARTGNLGGQAPWVGALRSFRGPAPPGSLVKLKLDGATVASQLVGLSGRYEFLDIPVSGRGALVVEVEIYDRHNLLVPQEVRRELVSASWQVLPWGRVIHVAGGGWGGFFGRDLFGQGRSRDGAFFYGFRKALTSWATGELLLQSLGDSWQVGGGLLASPTPWWFVGAELAKGQHSSAYLVESQVSRKAFEVSLRALSQGAGFGLGMNAPRRFDRSLELRSFLTRWLEVGVWGRDVTVGEQRFRWVRPTLGLSWRQWLFLRVFPDQEGDLWAVLFSHPHPRLRFSASLGSTQTYDATYDLVAYRWQARTTVEAGGSSPSRLTATLGRLGQSWWSPAFRVGVSHSGGHTGPYLEASTRLGGLWLRAEYQGVPRRVRVGEAVKPRFYVSLTADYAYASGTFTPAGVGAGQQFVGAVAGRLMVVNGSKRSLAGARVVVVGVGGGVSDESGRFYVGGIPPGVYEVILDPERIPLELSPKRLRAVVEVQAGLTTRVDFLLEELFGLAGQVRAADGKSFGEVLVVLLDERGVQVGRVSTDSFGYYRLDQVPKGTYLVQAVGKDGKVLAERRVTLEEFLFDQDLVSSAPVFEKTTEPPPTLP